MNALNKAIAEYNGRSRGSEPPIFIDLTAESDTDGSDIECDVEYLGETGPIGLRDASEVPSRVRFDAYWQYAWDAWYAWFSRVEEAAYENAYGDDDASSDWVPDADD